MANSKFGIDTQALITQYEQATNQQGEALRKAVHDATLKALQQRELTLKAIRDVVKTVTETASAGAQRNVQGVDMNVMLGQTVAGIDGAVRQAVQASQRALQQLLDQGLDVREKQVKKAMADIEKMEDQVYETMRKAVDTSGLGAMQNAWTQAMAPFGQGGSATGQAATQAVQELMARAQDAAREGRAFNQRAAQVFMDHYATLVSGVLIGMSEAMGGAAPSKPAAGRKTRG